MNLQRKYGTEKVVALMGNHEEMVFEGRAPIQENWEWESSDRDFLEKFPAELGKFEGGMKIVAGHVGTAVISENPRFHDIYYDGESHYY